MELRSSQSYLMYFFVDSARSDHTESSQHVSVLLDEITKALTEKEGELFLDCTFGGGGHTTQLLNAGQGTVHAIDCDPAALPRAEKLKAVYGDRFVFHDKNFAEIATIEEADFDGILFDFGVSSFQLDTFERGFSFREKALADMRMNPREGQPAYEFLEEAPEQELVEAIRNFGEESAWKHVVRAIMKARGTGKLTYTDSLAALIEEAIPVNPRLKPKRIHPATKSFQGIRMVVNQELQVIEEALPIAFEKLKIGGRLAVISFHSLEDRIVKRYFRKLAGRPEHANDHRPQQMRLTQAKLFSGKPISPSEQELLVNPRSRSAKLRILEKVTPHN